MLIRKSHPEQATPTDGDGMRRVRRFNQKNLRTPRITEKALCGVFSIACSTFRFGQQGTAVYITATKTRLASRHTSPPFLSAAPTVGRFRDFRPLSPFSCKNPRHFNISRTHTTKSRVISTFPLRPRKIARNFNKSAQKIFSHLCAPHLSTLSFPLSSLVAERFRSANCAICTNCTPLPALGLQLSQ